MMDFVVDVLKLLVRKFWWRFVGSTDCRQKFPFSRKKAAYGQFLIILTRVCVRRIEGTLVMVTISEVKGNSRDNRTAAHTHIKGLGLKGDGYAETSGAGFVGQAAAREVCHSALCGNHVTERLLTA